MELFGEYVSRVLQMNSEENFYSLFNCILVL